MLRRWEGVAEAVGVLESSDSFTIPNFSPLSVAAYNDSSNRSLSLPHSLNLFAPFSSPSSYPFVLPSYNITSFFCPPPPPPPPPPFPSYHITPINIST